MENTSKLSPVSDRDMFYYRQRSKNRLFEAITAFYAEEAECRDISKRDIADALRRDPASITRWLTAPSNITSDTVSDLLLSLGAEMEYRVVKFDDQPFPNEMHPLIARLMQPVVQWTPQPPTKPYTPLARTRSDSQLVELEPVS